MLGPPQPLPVSLAYQSADASFPVTEKVHSSSRRTPPVIHTINDLIVSRAADETQVDLVAYPSRSDCLTDYEHLTGKELDIVAGRAARKLMSDGFEPTTIAPVVALLGTSDLDYFATLLGLSRLGYTVLLLSTRLALPAFVSLLDQTATIAIVSSPQFSAQIKEIQSERPLPTSSILSRQEYDWTNTTSQGYEAPPSTSQQAQQHCFIVHSSGSTGLPKPIFQTHGACLANYSSGFPLRGFISLPLYHNHGLSCTFRAIYSRNCISFFHTRFPMTGPNLADAMRVVQPQIMFSVPYALKLLGESSEGIKALQSCKIVLFGGSGCPDELGNRLVANKVNLVAHYGSTEVGQLMTSFRPEGDDAWDYYRILPGCKEFVLMDEISPGLYECVGLDGLKAMTTTNSDDPPKSFRTRDVFSRHPTIDGWKYIGRLDDRVTLVNGEKVLPLPIEGRIREEPSIAEAIVFGIGKALPGLLAIRSETAEGLSDEDFVRALWPAVQEANARAEAFSHIDKDMIIPLPAGTAYPRTDKGTFIRAQVYATFDSLITAAYKAFEDGGEGTLVLELAELEQWLLQKFRDLVDVELDSVTSDFFSAGVDSLQAIKIYGAIKKNLSLGGAKVSQNAVYEQQNVAQLARYLFAVRTGREVEQQDEIALMSSLIKKYSTIASHTPGHSPEPTSKVIIITGTTGSLGAHILVQCLQRPDVSKVYCLVRATTPTDALSRVLGTLREKQLTISGEQEAKITALPSDFSQSSLGIPEDILAEMKHSVSCIIHSAWAVNFNLGVQSFEDQHIKGTYNLINLAQSVDTPKAARFYFCSSVSAGSGIVPAIVAEGPIDDLQQAQSMGYARSKLVTEHITLNAAKAGADARVFRIGQISGDGDGGLWNDTEAIPLLIRSALTTGCLPELDENPRWLPVDILAKAVLQLSGIDGSMPSTDPSVVYHLQNPASLSWNSDLLPALRKAGLGDFEIVPQREWIRRLRSSNQDPIVNPSIKLLDFFASKYDNDEPGRKGLVFETKRTEEDCDVLRGGVDVIGGGYVEKYVKSWMQKWKT